MSTTNFPVHNHNNLADFPCRLTKSVSQLNSSCQQLEENEDCREEGRGEDVEDSEERLTVIELLLKESSLQAQDTAINAADKQKSGTQLQPIISSEVFHSSLVPMVTNQQVAFIRLKEVLRERLRCQFNYQGHVYSDLGAGQAFCAHRPFFSTAQPMTRRASNSRQSTEASPPPLHLVVFVHGLEGSAADLRIVRVFLQLATAQFACKSAASSSQCDEHTFEYLMSSVNKAEATFQDFHILAENLAKEIDSFVASRELQPRRLSFVGHSMGNIIIRGALNLPEMRKWHSNLHVFLSLSGPHLGTLYNRSNIVNLGLWLIRRYKKNCGSLHQLCMMDRSASAADVQQSGHNSRDSSLADLRNTYLYQLSRQPGLELFKYVLLVCSQQDSFVPYHSSRIELCRDAIRDSSQLGRVYSEMVGNICSRVVHSPRNTTLVRYDVSYSVNSISKISSSKDRWIGKAAHTAVIDSELFLEKLMSVAVAKYFL